MKCITPKCQIHFDMETPVIHIFVDEVNQRLMYALNLMLNDRGVKYQLENDPVRFKSVEGPKFVYSDYPFNEPYLTFSPAEILFENTISSVFVEKVVWEEMEILAFKKVPDIFASVFYVASLYHEHLTDRTDEHERIIGKDSFLDKQGWLNKCIIDYWSDGLISLLRNQFSIELPTPNKELTVVPTFDIDNAYAYKHKTGMRKYLSTLKDWLKWDIQRIKERKLVLSGAVKDPYDNYDYIRNISERGFPVKLFWLLGDFSDFDRNIDWKDPYHRRLILQMKRHAVVGLHPSYKSNQQLGLLCEEKKRLEQILGKEVANTRQHFLKIEHKKTFVSLVGAGFTHDYSLGFADVVGFRAGLSRPFPWFNLRANRISELTLHPFAYMEVTLKDYLRLNPQEAKVLVEELWKEAVQHGGEFICLWHNETIGDTGKWKGWQEVLEFTLNFQNLGR